MWPNLVKRVCTTYDSGHLSPPLRAAGVVQGAHVTTCDGSRVVFKAGGNHLRGTTEKFKHNGPAGQGATD